MVTMMLRAALLASLAAFSLAAPEVQIGDTTLVGQEFTGYGLKQDFFGGIPFAEPPVGALRLQPPVLKTKLDGPTFDASNSKNACLQPGLPFSIISEDCLFLNIFRPSNLPKNASLPILFWTYGGGFTTGNGAWYNGSSIVAQSASRGTPLIYVSFNYRMGPLGYPQGREAGQKGALNLALRDELAALAWVHENIGYFGGDPTKVTLLGESAGAIMNSILYLNSPLAKYARAAIFQSGSPATALTYGSERRENVWQGFVGGVPSCASLAKSGSTFDCLKKANTTEIYNALLNSLATSPVDSPYVPNLDGPGGLYPDHASTIFASGRFARLPFITGTNLDEGTTFIPSYITSSEQLKNWLAANYTSPEVNPQQLNKAMNKIFELYPDNPAVNSPFGTGNETFGHPLAWKQGNTIQGDIIFTSLRRNFQQTAARFGLKSYGYLFTEPIPENIQQGVGVCHGSDVPFIFGGPPETTGSSGKTISALMIDYWISFTTSLDPNDGKGLTRPRWDQYTSSKAKVIQLNGANVTMIPDDFRKKQMDYLNSIPLVLHH